MVHFSGSSAVPYNVNSNFRRAPHISVKAKKEINVRCLLQKIAFDANLRVPFHKPGLDINLRQLTESCKKEVLFTRVLVATV